MLQINSGKLFQNGIGRTNSLRGVLYTNLKLPWQRDVVTAAGTLRETDGGRALDDARQKIETWRQDYNQVRPHSSLGWLTPDEFVVSLCRAETCNETPSGISTDSRS